MTEREHYIEKAQSRIDLWNAEIEKAIAKLNDAEADTKIQYQKQLAEMRARRDEADAKMQELVAVSDGAWDDVKLGFDNAWDDIADSFNKAKSRFN